MPPINPVVDSSVSDCSEMLGVPVTAYMTSPFPLPWAIPHHAL